jgi:hypothetical protein
MSAVIATLFVTRETLAGVLAAPFVVVNVLMVLVALYPAERAGVCTDGSRLIMLRRGGPDAGRWIASFWIIGLSFLGRRPASWPEDWVRSATEYEDMSPDDFQAAMILYARALDENDLAAARVSLARAKRSLHLTSLIARPEYHIEAAFLAALAGDVREADAHLEAVEGNLIRQASLQRARAARCWAAGDREAAARHATAGINAAPDDWDEGMTAVDLHWLKQFAQ